MGGAAARRRGDGGAGHRAFAQAAATPRTKEFVKLAGREDEEEALAHGLGGATLRAIKFTGGKSSELLRHKASMELERKNKACGAKAARVQTSVRGVSVFKADFLDFLEGDEDFFRRVAVLHLQMEVAGRNADRAGGNGAPGSPGARAWNAIRS